MLMMAYYAVNWAFYFSLCNIWSSCISHLTYSLIFKLKLG